MSDNRRNLLDYFRRPPSGMRRVRPMLNERAPSRLEQNAYGCLTMFAIMFAVATVSTVVLMLWEWWTAGHVKSD